LKSFVAISRLFQGLRSVFVLGTSDSDSRINDFEKKFLIESKAKESGEHNFPPSNAAELSGNELNIVAFFIDEMGILTRDKNDELTSYRTSAAHRIIENSESEIKNLSTVSQDELMQDFEAAKVEINVEKTRLDEQKKYFDAFKLQNGLDKRADYPDSRLLAYGVVLFLWLVESVMNSFFFAKGSDFGFLGGLITAGGISAINIILGFAIGNGVMRYKNSCQTVYRWFGYISLLLYGTAIAVLNFVVGHYRDLVASYTDNPEHLVMQKIIDSPLMMQDVFSWLLMITGILFSIFALVDGYKVNDPYPKFGNLQRKLDEKEEYYNAGCKSLAEEGLEKKEEFIKELKKLQKYASAEFTYFTQASGYGEATIAAHDKGIQLLITRANAMLMKYRQFNMKYRKHEPPVYFNKQWAPEKDFELTQPEPINLPSYEARVESIMKLVRRSENDLNKIYSKYFDKIHKIETPKG